MTEDLLARAGVKAKGHGSLSVDGFDPLESEPAAETLRGMMDDANRRIVLNILNSYAGFYDLFSELIQNALDAVQHQRRLLGDSYKGRIWILLDLKNRRVRVVDNGVGMDQTQFKFCLRPSVSFKKGDSLRGHKGVGATYLAYGFSLIKLQTRKDGVEIAAVLRGGRKWAEDESGTVPRPRFEQQRFEVGELEGYSSGTAVEVLLGDSPGERPRDLLWIGARTAEQWFNVLRIKTPLGGVYLRTPPFRPQVDLTVIDNDQSRTDISSNNAEYFYPHEMPGRVKALGEITTAVAKIQGDPTVLFSKLSNDYKKLDGIWEIWDKDQILAESSPFATAIQDPQQRQLIERHNVIVYGAFLRSAKMWNEFNEDILKLRKNTRLMHGGLQMASDGMVQGDLSIIPLTSTIGYQANSHVVVHFTDANPDMGRKVFQPELKALADLLSVRAVTIFKKHLSHLRPDTGSVVLAPSRELHEWKRQQEEVRDKRPLALKTATGELALISEPQQEQDVVALFHELLGLGIIRGLKIFATSSHTMYDSLFYFDYPDTSFRFDKENNFLGVSTELTFPISSEPKVLEYKFDLDSLVADFERDLKFPQHVNFVVCWDAGGEFKDRIFLNPLLVGDEGSARTIFGATHQAFMVGSSEVRFEVLVLKDLLSYLTSPHEEEARQKMFYREN